MSSAIDIHLKCWKPSPAAPPSYPNHSLEYRVEMLNQRYDRIIAGVADAKHTVQSAKCGAKSPS